LLRNADEYPFVYLVLNQIPPRDYQKPRAWGAVPDNGSVPSSQPAQSKNVLQSSSGSTPLSQPRKPIGAGSNQLTRLVEKGDKALAAWRYDEAADYLTEALRYVSNEEERQDVKQRLAYTYTLKGEKLLPEIQRRKQNGESYFALLRDARSAFELALQYDANNQVAKERLAQLKS